MEHISIPLTNRHLPQLNPLIAGYQRCKPGHRFGPHIRSYTLLHYVLSGKGTLYEGGNAYPVQAGQMFCILPGQITTYEADSQDPWHYCWVGFNGNLSEAFEKLGPVVTVDKALFTGIFPDAQEANPELWIAGGLFRLYARLFPPIPAENLHVQRAKNLIRSRYMEGISVESIAANLSLDRRYLSRLFKTHTGHTIQEYLIRVRMEAADRCLQQGHSVQEAAALCGYRDVPNFSRMYKRNFGIAPKRRQKANGTTC